MSADSDESIKKKAFEAGVDFFLSKPFTLGCSAVVTFCRVFYYLLLYLLLFLLLFLYLQSLITYFYIYYYYFFTRQVYFHNKHFETK